MGSQTHLLPKTEFAHKLNAYFKALIDDRGWDASGRNMEAAVKADEPRRSLWSKVYHDKQAMNANEIEIAARIFMKTPQEFVTESRYYNGYLPVNVGALAQTGGVLPDDVERKLRQAEHDLAALRGRNEAEIPHAE